MTKKRRGRGEGSITQRKDGSWMGRISLGETATGKRNRRTVYGKTKKEVLEKLRDLQRQYDQGSWTEPSLMTVANYLDHWCENIAKNKIANATYDRYRLIVDKQLIPHVGNIRLDKLTPFHITSMQGTLEQEGVSPRTRQMAHVVFGTALRAAVKLKILANNPIEAVARPKVPKKEMSVWNGDQVRSFLEAAKEDRLHALFVLAIDTGARLGELLGLMWTDVDFDNATLSIQRSVEEIRGSHQLKQPKTNKGRRQVTLSQSSIDALLSHRKAMLTEGNTQGLIFCTKGGNLLRKTNVTRQNFRRTTERADLPRIRFHDLRHTCATLLLQAGVNVKVVSERLGHENIQITLDTYSHILPGMQEVAADTMDRIISGIATDGPESETA